MKQLRIALVLSVFAVSSLGFAANESTSEFEPNIKKSNILASGAFSYRNSSNTFGDENNHSFQTEASVQYFVIDRVAVGLGLGHSSFGFDSGQASHFLRMGPEATYYFWQNGNLAAKAGMNLGWSKAFVSGFETDDAFYLGGTLGLDFFFTESVAFGPSAYYTHTTGFDEFGGQLNDYGLAAEFSLLL